MSDPFGREFLAIDFGTRRIGVAKSDPMGMIASPLSTIKVKSKAEAVRKVADLLDQYQPSGLVIGYPLHESGSVSEKCLEIDAFLLELSASYSGPVFRIDEFDTSNEASAIVVARGKRTSRKKGRIDAIAAVLILQRFLSEHPA